MYTNIVFVVSLYVMILSSTPDFSFSFLEAKNKQMSFSFANAIANSLQKSRVMISIYKIVSLDSKFKSYK